MQRSLILFAVGAFILFAFLPIIGSLTASASETTKTESITFTITTANENFILTDKQFNALLSAYNGEAKQFKITISSGTFILVNNFELVSPNHEWKLYFNTPGNFGFYDNATETYLFIFYDFAGFKFFQFYEEAFEYNGEQYILFDPTDYEIKLLIITETQVAPLLNLVPILAVIIFTSLAVLYIKFK